MILEISTPREKFRNNPGILFSRIPSYPILISPPPPPLPPHELGLPTQGGNNEPIKCRFIFMTCSSIKKLIYMLVSKPAEF
jgi:hypothetical protein